jgi:aromatic-L-amino-acid decarboxylase
MSERDQGTDTTLELSAEEMRRLVDTAMERIVRHIESLPAQPAADTEGGRELARSLIEPLPEEGRPYSELLDLLFQKLVPKTFNTASPGYLAYIPGGGIFHAALADLISSSVNRYMGVFAAAPGLSQLEANVVRWFCQIVGYPAQAGGILASGGSLANFTALVTARRERLPENFLSGALYASDQTHHSVQKAAILAGFPASNMRPVPSDEQFRIRLDRLEEMIEEDRQRHLTPFLLVANAGTTNTGAVDPLIELAEVARRQRMWLHVDAAYGGFFMLTDQGRRVMRGLEMADSIVLDPHKGLFLPYGTGALLVRDGQALRRAHTAGADYLPEMQHDPDLVDFCEVSPELSRPFRGLRVWLPFKLHGIEPFRRNLEEKLELARWITDQLREIDGIEILAEPQLSIVAFRLRVPGANLETASRINRELMERVNRRRRVYLTGTMLDERFAIRVCVLSFRTHLDRMKEGMEAIRSAISETLATASDA